MFGFGNVLECVYVGFVMCGLCVVFFNMRVFRCGFCNVWLCVCVGFLMCALCVDFLICGCLCVGFVLCGCVCVCL